MMKTSKDSIEAITLKPFWDSLPSPLVPLLIIKYTLPNYIV